MIEGTRILVVEDNEELQRLALRALGRHGYVVAQALTFADFLREMAAATPDLIVLDVRLPDADGRDILANLKKNPKTASIPVVIWSGRLPDSDTRVALDLGAEDFIEKGPVSVLVSKIDRILQRLSEPRMQA
jgi:DNA-binding response OmpR family regulator